MTQDSMYALTYSHLIITFVLAGKKTVLVQNNQEKTYSLKTVGKWSFSQNWAAVGQKPTYGVHRRAPVETLPSFLVSECCHGGGKNAAIWSSPSQH